MCGLAGAPSGNARLSLRPGHHIGERHAALRARCRAKMVLNYEPDRVHAMHLKIELEQEDDGRWIAEIPQLPGVLAYGASADDAAAKAQILALRVVAERLEHGESKPVDMSITVAAV